MLNAPELVKVRARADHVRSVLGVSLAFFVCSMRPALGMPVEDLPQAVNESLGLRASQVATVHAQRSAHATISATVPLGPTTHVLDLEPSSVRSPHYQVLVQTVTGDYVYAKPGPVRTYRGGVRGMAGSLVAASLEEDGLHARVVLADGEEFFVEPISRRVPGAALGSHAVYRSEDIIPTTARCEAHAALQGAGASNDTSGAEAFAGAPACGSGVCVAELAADADYEYFVRWGSTAAVEERINAVINAVNVQYERDASIRHTISTIIIRTTEPDPYTSTDAVTLLTEFRAQWLYHHGNVQRDMAQLFTGKDMNGGTIGVAWVSAVCTSSGFSVVQSDFNSNFGCTTDLSAHELGHNWSAAHCDCVDPPYTMNPFVTCANRFEPNVTIPSIVAHRDSRGCLDPGTSCASDADCDDGLYCTGFELCNAGMCETTGDPCPGEACDESSATCAPRVCDENGLCQGAEDCLNCPSDCLAASGGVCGNGICEAGASEDCVNCPQDCQGKLNGKPAGRFCCGNAGEYAVGCDDERCLSGGSYCVASGGMPSCCGDGICEGVETDADCATDCAIPCSADRDCDGGSACHVGACVAGNCTFTVLDCDDGDPCTADHCDSITGCLNAPIQNCGCGPKNGVCASDADCCSGRCKRNGRCM